MANKSTNLDQEVTVPFETIMWIKKHCNDTAKEKYKKTTL